MSEQDTQRAEGAERCAYYRMQGRRDNQMEWRCTCRASLGIFCRTHAKMMKPDPIAEAPDVPPTGSE